MNPPGHDSLIVPDWPAPVQVRAASTLRTGGTSQGDYASLNLSTGVGDDAEAVTRNREILADMLDLPAEPLWLKQVHGTTVLDLDGGRPASRRSASERPAFRRSALERPAFRRSALERSVPKRASSRQPPAADGAVTSRPGQPCVIQTADCLPILLCDISGTRVGAAHAGWRGLAGGVLESAVQRMSADPGQLLAWIGPGIGPRAYEVGAEVMDAFIAIDPSAAQCFAANARGRWQADLYGLARQRLRAAGVEAIYGGDWCTHTETKRFFSHRREAPCGRMATVIWLEA